MIAHKGKPFSLICIEARLDSQPWSRREAWTCCPGVLQPQALQSTQLWHYCSVPCTMLLTHPSSCRPSCAQEWHSMALHRHVPASQFQLWPHCPSWGCFSGFLELQIWETSSKHNLRRAPLVSQTEVACTSGEFGPHFIWPTVILIAKNHQTPNPKTHEERHLDGIKAWTLKQTMGHEEPRRYDSLLPSLTGLCGSQQDRRLFMPFKHNQTCVRLFSLSQPWLSRCCQSLRYCLELPCDKML